MNGNNKVTLQDIEANILSEPVKRSGLDKAIRLLAQITPREPEAITYDIGWQIIDIVQKELIPAIDPKQPKQLIPEKK